MIYALLLICLCFFGACSTTHNATTDVWADAAIITEQAAVIAEQQRTLEEMGGAVGEIREYLEGARGNLERAIEQAASLREQWEAIDKFVRAVIEAERGLEEVQRTDRGEEAGEGYGLSRGLRGDKPP